MSPPPRLVPEIPFPPYAHVPGQTPHPVSDPGGHRFAAAPVRPEVPDAEHWRDCKPYLYAIDLFNHGYYWEAHEVWEGLWHACGRAGTVADFLKGLIKLAAAGVKAREGRPVGVRNHARRAAELFRGVAEDRGGEGASFLGLPLAGLIEDADRVSNVLHSEERGNRGAAEGILPFPLRPV